MKKALNKFLSLALVLVMLFGVAAVGGSFTLEAQAADGYKVGDIIEFGSYPQSEVKDSATLEALNSKTLNWISYGYYIGDGNFGSMVQSDYMKYADVTHNGDKYRAVIFTEYRPYRTILSADYMSYSEQYKNGYYKNTTYWFKYEPIKWRVLDPVKGLLFSETCIDSQPYSNTVYKNGVDSIGHALYWNDAAYTHYASDYATSSIREWLNDDFYNTAFDTTQQEKIAYTTLDNSSSYKDVYDSVSTTDKVFLLSHSDVLNPAYGFIPSTTNSDVARYSNSTDYSKVQGCMKEPNFETGYAQWYLRSPGKDSYSVGYVPVVGFVSENMSASYSSTGIRPAICLNKNTINTVTVTDVTQPVIGATASWDWEIPSNQGYSKYLSNSVDSGFWAETKMPPTSYNSFENGTVYRKSDGNFTFKADRYYTFVAWVKADSGYMFSENLSATINDYNSRKTKNTNYIAVWLCFGKPTIAKTLSSISVTTQPTKKTYTAGQNFDKSGMVVKANYSDGTSATITNYTVTNGNNLPAGQTSVTISYTEGGITKTTTVPITVKSATATLTGIEVTSAPSNTELKYKSTASTDGLKVTAKYSDGTTKDVTNQAKVSNFSANNKRGTHTATVEFEGMTATFNYNVYYSFGQWLIIIILFGWIWY